MTAAQAARVGPLAGRAAARALVHIHTAAFPDFFLTQLGPAFLAAYYSELAADPSGIALVARDDDGVPIGFVVGALDPRGFYSRLFRRKWWRFALVAIPAVLRNPRRVRRVARASRHSGDNPSGTDVCGLFSIAVSPTAQSAGTGRALVEAFIAEARSRGAHAVFLTTDRDGNDAVNHFYIARGFTLERSFETPEGRRMNEYWIRFG